MSTADRPTSLAERIGKALRDLSADAAPGEKGFSVDERIKFRIRPDLLFRRGNRVFFVEVKTGTHDLPLPSSANSQMLIYQAAIKDAFKTAEGDPRATTDVVPILVTNYQVDRTDLDEFNRRGIKLIRIDESKSDEAALREQLSPIFAE
jgi:hypothetical protein